MIYPLVRDLASVTVAGAPVRVPVAVTCRVLGFSRQAYYAWLADPVSDHDLEDAYLTDAALDAHANDPEFGYWLVADQLRAAGHQASDNRVWRLCRDQRISSAHSRKRGAGRRPGPPAWSAGPRRSARPTRRRSGLHRDGSERGVVDRHHRAPDR